MSDAPCDKDYLLTPDGLLFNVVGYEHPPDAALANLKYVAGEKWNAGYAQALDFLRANWPEYADEFIVVPARKQERWFRSQDGLTGIERLGSPNRLQRMALDLSRCLAAFLDLPGSRFGLTDSLLWGEGSASSDIDLVVFGADAARRVLERIIDLHKAPDFQFLPDRYERPRDVPASAVERIRQRRFHLGVYRDVKFSLRAVRDRDEIETATDWKSEGKCERTTVVADNSESLFFPAVYKLECDEQLVCYHAAYEGVFRVGERIHLCGVLETDGARTRIVVGDRASEGARWA